MMKALIRPFALQVRPLFAAAAGSTAYYAGQRPRLSR